MIISIPVFHSKLSFQNIYNRS